MYEPPVFLIIFCVLLIAACVLAVLFALFVKQVPGVQNWIRLYRNTKGPEKYIFLMLIIFTFSLFVYLLIKTN
jgi:hypothetical protein